MLFRYLSRRNEKYNEKRQERQTVFLLRFEPSVTQLSAYILCRKFPIWAAFIEVHFYRLIHKFKLKGTFLPHCIWCRCDREQQLVELLQLLSRAKLSSSLPATSMWFACSVHQFRYRVYRP